jgi:hypothetical protein
VGVSTASHTPSTHPPHTRGGATQPQKETSLNLAHSYNVLPVKMESESSSVAPSLGINSKLDNTNVFQSYSYSQPSLAPFNNSYQSTPYSSSLSHFQSSNDIFEAPKTMPMNTQRSNLDNNSLQGLQSRLIESNKLANAPQDKISLTQSSSSMSSGPVPVNGPGTPSTGQSFAYDERFHALYEREIRWNEVSSSHA